PAEQSDDPRKRRRCSAWRYSAVYTEWCRSLGALPVPNAGQWLGSTPAGCEVCRGSPAENESATLDRDLPKSALDVQTSQPACVNKVLANREPSTHGTKPTCHDVRLESAIGGKPDIEQTSPKGRL